MSKNTRLKTGDTVVIRTGSDKGKIGKITSIDLEKERVIVEGVNAAKRHRKPSMNDRAGGIEEINRPIHISNVGIAEGKNPKRVAYKIDAKGNKKRVIAGSTKEVK